MTELLCSRGLAIRLGAIVPDTIQHHRYLKRRGAHLLVRDIETDSPMFWKWELTKEDLVSARSS